MATLDPALSIALEKALGHTPPFAPDESAAYAGHLTILHGYNLAGLDDFVNLTSLDLFASNITDLAVISGMSKLTRLRVVCSSLKVISALNRCEALESIDLIYTLVEDVTPLISLLKLHRMQILGCPLLPESRDSLAQLQKTGAKTVGYSNEADWRITRALAERGIPCVFSIFEGNSWFVRPGVPQIPNADCDFTMIPRFYLESLMQDSGFSADDVFSQMGLGNRNNESPRHRFDFQSHYTIGSSEDALAWIKASGLNSSEKDALAQFVENFSSLLFFKEDAALLDAVETRHRVKLPLWFREIRQTLAFVLPYDFVQLQLEEMDRWYPSGEDASDLWYELRLRGVDGEDQRGIIDTNHLFPVGAWLPTAELVFAIKLNDESDQRVFSYRVDNMTIEGNVPPESILTVSPTYAEFLTHITALRTDTGEVFHAQN